MVIVHPLPYDFCAYSDELENTFIQPHKRQVATTPLRSTSLTDSDWEDHFSEWARPPGKTEQSRCDNAVSAIKNAVDKSPKLKHRFFKVFPQGSYRNRVNVKKDSDVDVGVLCYESYMYQTPKGMTLAQLGNYDKDADYTYISFKDDLEKALISYFGSDAVKRGNKAINVRETSYHVEADVVPVFEFRSYAESGRYVAGVALRPDDGGRILNFPERLRETWPQIQLHYENGVAKNKATSQRFKSTVRIIKKLRNVMDEAGFNEAKPIPGYLIECLVWNVPDNRFSADAWLDTVRSVLGSIWSATKDESNCGDWSEVDDMKYLFRPQQPWARQHAHEFVDKAWDFIGIS